MTHGIQSYATTRLERWQQSGSIDSAFVWLLGVPLPLLILFYCLHGCR